MHKTGKILIWNLLLARKVNNPKLASQIIKIAACEFHVKFTRISHKDVRSCQLAVILIAIRVNIFAWNSSEIFSHEILINMKLYNWLYFRLIIFEIHFNVSAWALKFLPSQKSKVSWNLCFEGPRSFTRRDNN